MELGGSSASLRHGGGEEDGAAGRAAAAEEVAGAALSARLAADERVRGWVRARVCGMHARGYGRVRCSCRRGR